MDLKNLQHKKQKLQDIKKILKNEFFGINSVIDQIIEKIQPWYFFNDTQTHPYVINLWGLTGTGKTSLIKRLVELLDKEQSYCRLEMSNLRSINLNDELTKFTDTYDGNDFIVCLDEFQHARTINDNGEEMENQTSFNLWDFVDTGEFKHFDRRMFRNDYFSWSLHLQDWIDYGIKITNGKVYLDQQSQEASKYFKNRFKKEIHNSEYFEYLDASDRRSLYSLFRNTYKNIFEFEQNYFNLNEQGILLMLQEASQLKQKTDYRYLKNSLIFVVGNLDEAYTMSKNFSPDLSADEFYKLSLNINLPEIKEALKKRFRNEQIARLGNNHIIYPALSQQAYQALIHNYLQQTAIYYQKQFKLQLNFDSSVHRVIYANSVIPTQGVRPVLSSLKSMINGRMGELFCHLAEAEIEADAIDVSYKEHHLHANYLKAKTEMSTVSVPVEVSFDDIRAKVTKNRQAATAVHEAGHAVISICLLHNIPQQLTAKTASSSYNGFAAFDSDHHHLITKQDMLHHVARALGGIEAERLIFGEKGISFGSSSDLESLTEILLKAFMRNGLGKQLGFFKERSAIYQNVLETGMDAIELEVKQCIAIAQNLCQQLLKDEKTLLLKIAERLMKHNSLHEKDLQKLIATYAKNISLEEIEKQQNKEPHADKLEAELANIASSDLALDERFIKNFSEFIERN